MAGSFLDSDSVDATLKKLARTDSLTVFVGAGASMEVGLPSWPDLVDRLVRRVAQDRGLDDEKSAVFVDAIRQEADGVIGAATVVRAHFSSQQFRGDANEFIRQELYRDPDSDDVVDRQFGPTARAVAKLIALWPLGDIEIVTTNYDPLLERAVDAYIKEQRPLQPVHNLIGATSGQSGPQVYRRRLRVRHLHGALDPSGDASGDLTPIVIAEGDYHDVQGSQAWQREFMLDRLTLSTCLFVGASMTDVNVLRFLRLAQEGHNPHRHVALVTRGPEQQPADSETADALREAVQSRWSEYGVEVLYPNYFLETSQFIEELVRRRRSFLDGGDPDDPSDRYRARLVKWQDSMATTTMCIDPIESFYAAQDRANEALQGWLAVFVDAMPTNLRADCSRETFGLQLWAARDGGQSLLLWAQSTNSWRDPRVLEPLPMRLPSQWGAVQCYCAGSPVLQLLPDTMGTRWRSALNVPIFLDDDLWGRLPVGVLALSAMHRHGVSVLRQLKRQARDALVNVMVAAATEYWIPEPLVAPANEAVRVTPAKAVKQSGGRR